MAQSGFTVTPKTLKDSADLINEKVSSYTTEVNSIYSEISNLMVNWKGQTSEVFNQRLEGYRNGFNELAKTLTDYTTFLANASVKYSSTDERLAGEASQKLKTGN